jgi:NAD(P)-dependent dehydrogenase (short-subunit alcohol dehydrogenase family)
MGLMSLIGTNLPIRNVRFHGESWRVSGRATEIAKATSCQRCQGVIHATRAVMGSMRARRYGRIVNLTSIAAIGNALPGNAFYAATKAKVVILTLCPGAGSARHHRKRRGVRLRPHRHDAARAAAQLTGRGRRNASLHER